MLARFQSGNASSLAHGIVTNKHHRAEQWTIHSVLASAKIADSLPIKELRASGAFSEHGKVASQQTMSFRIGPRGLYITLFRNGTATIRGCRSVDEAQAVLEEVRTKVAGFAIVSTGRLPILVQNIVALVDFGMPLNLLRISETLSRYDVSYEPEQFPGLILRPEAGRVVVLVFGSGKLVVVGSRSEDQLRRTLRQVLELLNQIL